MLKIRLVDTDTLDSDNHYYLYEVTGDDFHYFVSRSDEENNQEDRDTVDYTNDCKMYNRSDFTDREWEIAKYLFIFLWDSSNGVNTCVEQDIYEDDGFTREEIEDFYNKFNFKDQGTLDMYSEGGVEIFWSYFSCFNLMNCDFWEDYK